VHQEQTIDAALAREAQAPPAGAARDGTCECHYPIAEERAERKGAARTYCARCGLPVPITFRW
jgi:hypothetical protein